MGRYARLHDKRVHSDDVEKNPPEGLRNRASCDPADEAVEAMAQAQAEEAKYYHVGGGSGRLGAAVQRAMAMRERQSTQDGNVKGIGAIRHLYNTPSAPPAAAAAAGAEYWSTAEEEARQSNIVFSPLPGIQNQSMRYSRFFCSGPDADEDKYSSLNKALDLANNITCRCLTQSHQVCEACNSLTLPQRSENAPATKKGFLRKLFRLQKKSTA